MLSKRVIFLSKKILMEHGAKIYETLPLHVACLYGHLDLVTDLLRNGADVNALNAVSRDLSVANGFSLAHGYTPLAGIHDRSFGDIFRIACSRCGSKY